MKLPNFLSNLKDTIYPDFLKHIFIVLGSIWLLIEMGSFMIPWVENSARGNATLFLICLSLAIAFGLVKIIRRHTDERRRTEEISVSHKLVRNDILIEIRVDNLFDVEGAFVLSTNTTFDTDMSAGLISKMSLQGQFTTNYYDKVEHLNRDLEESLKGEVPISEDTIGNTKRHKIGGKTKCYEIGTVAQVCPTDEVVVYLVAIAHINDNGKAYGTVEEVIKGLGKLWYYIGEHGELEPIVVPVLGTGLTRIRISREDMIREIIKSFITACSEKKFTEKLTIVISESDYRKYKIDLDELGKYLYHHCKYTVLKSKTDTGRGEEIP